MAADLVLTMGTFDLLHHGHLAFLRRCRGLGARLVVGVNTDEFASSFKTPPVMTLAERLWTLTAAGYETIANPSPGRELIEAVKPATLAVGSDWASRDYLAQIDVPAGWLEAHRITLAVVARRQWDLPISTTELRERVWKAEEARRAH